MLVPVFVFFSPLKYDETITLSNVLNHSNLLLLKVLLKVAYNGQLNSNII